MNISQSLSTKQIQKLSQVLSPKMIQMLKTFHLGYNDLLNQINDEVEENVFLEIQRYDQLLEYGSRRNASSGSEFMDRDFAEFTSDEHAGKDLQSYLEQQIKLELISDKDETIALELIQHIDDRGYIENYYDLRPQLCQQLGIKERKLNDILKIIQTLEPEGVGARNLKECLLIQIENHEFSNEALYSIIHKTVAEHLDDLSENKVDKIADKLGIEIDGVQAIIDFIKQNLDPNPGHQFSKTPFNQHVIPSFECYIEDGQLVIINLEKTMGVQVNLSDNYSSILNQKGIDQKTKEFLEEKLKKAKELIDNIQKRHENIQRLAQYILDHQKAFIQYGKDYLEPLLQKTVSESLGISQSTVSRIVSSKYVQTPHGIFSFRFLCPRSHFGKTAKRLQRLIKHIAESDPSLSDEKISLILKGQGMNIARRTVTKYRHQSETKSSFDRKVTETNLEEM